MEISINIEGSLQELMKLEIESAERAVSTAVAAAGAGIKQDWRNQISAAGLGKRLGNSIRQEIYPKHKMSLNAAALVYTKAPRIISAFERGALIRARGGAWLAIPLPAAGKRKGAFGKETPAEWQFRTGKKLIFVPPQQGSRTALLVAENSRVNSRGRAVALRRSARGIGPGRGYEAIPVFLLIRQARLPKLLNLFSKVDVAAGSIPGEIVARWK